MIMNMNVTDYIKAGAPSYYIASAKTFTVAGMTLPILQTGFGQPLSPVIVLQGYIVHIATPACAAVGSGSGYHFEGPVRVPDYLDYAVMPDTGTLFHVKSAWLGHFLGVIGFAPIPLPPIS
jgi:hypothetical protein